MAEQQISALVLHMESYAALTLDKKSAVSLVLLVESASTSQQKVPNTEPETGVSAIASRRNRGSLPIIF